MSGLSADPGTRALACPRVGRVWCTNRCMATTNDILTDGFGRVREGVHGVVVGLDPEYLTRRILPNANTIAWLVWHLTRVQDDHISEVAGQRQLWADGWYERFGLPFAREATGYGHDSTEVSAVVASGELLTGYYDAVHEKTQDYLRTLRPADLDRVVDERWDPPVTLAARIVSVLDDDAQHVGQAALVRGLL